LNQLARSSLPIGALLLFAAALAPAGAHAQQYPSARIESLGGDAVAGIIPDTLTDIYLNPAYLYRCSRLTINYGQRWTEDFSMRFPRMTIVYSNRQFLVDELDSHKATELTLYGIPLGSWRMGLSAAWYLEYLDNSVPEYYTGYYTYEIRQVAENNLSHRDLHNYRIDLSVSSELSPGTTLGLRVGGRQLTYTQGNTRHLLSYVFEIDEDENEILISDKRYEYDDQDIHEQVSSLFFQAGLLSGEGPGEKSLSLQVSRYEIYSRNLDRDINSLTLYDAFGNPYRYTFDETYYRDERSGILWRYDIRGRLSLPYGIRVFAGGGFEHMTYDTDWFDRDSDYTWREGWETTEVEDHISLEYGDEGDYKGFFFFLKTGKTTELRNNLKLTAGMHGYVRWMRSEEDPVALITVYSRVDSALITFPAERRIVISTESTSAGLSFPLAIEFEPARWISIWSGFRVHATYRKEKDSLPNIFAGDLLNFLDPSSVDSHLHQDGLRSVEDIDVSSTGSIGVSLHYRDRLFVDLYTGSDVTPDSITNYILDVRYAF